MRSHCSENIVVSKQSLHRTYSFYFCSFFFFNRNSAISLNHPLYSDSSRDIDTIVLDDVPLILSDEQHTMLNQPRRPTVLARSLSVICVSCCIPMILIVSIYFSVYKLISARNYGLPSLNQTPKFGSLHGDYFDEKYSVSTIRKLFCQ